MALKKAQVDKSGTTGAVEPWQASPSHGPIRRRIFCITQAFFPDSSAWDKLARSLKGVADEERFAAFSGTRSLPFAPGPHGRVAVKVIDPRGNEVMRVMGIGKTQY